MVIDLLEPLRKDLEMWRKRADDFTRIFEQIAGQDTIASRIKAASSVGFAYREKKRRTMLEQIDEFRRENEKMLRGTLDEAEREIRKELNQIFDTITRIKRELP